MPKKHAPTGTDRDLNLATLSSLFVDEEKAREFFEAKRWPNGPVCPHCQSSAVTKLTARPGSKKPVRAGAYQCNDCREQFTVRVGSIMEDSKLPICKWLMAFHLMTSSKKGVSSHQIARELGVTQKTAWFLCHRIREAMKPDDPDKKLDGTVEVDEAYIGGKPRHENNPAKKKYKKRPKFGRGTDKAPVMVLVERDGSSKAFPIGNPSILTMHEEVKKHVATSATLNTDEFAGYVGLDKHFHGGHKTVNHSKKEYVRFEKTGESFVSVVTTNTAESWFALLKRSFIGIHHKMSKKHLHRYCVERSFMWNQREVSDGDRMVAAMEGAECKRLMYVQSRSRFAG